MSIYREHRCVPDDLRTPNAVKNNAVSPPVATANDERYRAMRRGQPVNTPLPATLAWFTNLPADLKPNALMARYARIANFIAAAWTDPKSLAVYMDSLLTDKRGGRQGFPEDVLRELVALALHSQKVAPQAIDRSTWGEALRLGSRTSRER